MSALRELWKIFDRGDHLETSELEYLLISALAGRVYLQARGENLACFKTTFDINRITDILNARGVSYESIYSKYINPP